MTQLSAVAVLQEIVRMVKEAKSTTDKLAQEFHQPLAYLEESLKVGMSSKYYPLSYRQAIIKHTHILKQKIKTKLKTNQSVLNYAKTPMEGWLAHLTFIEHWLIQSQPASDAITSSDRLAYSNEVTHLLTRLARSNNLINKTNKAAWGDLLIHLANDERVLRLHPLIRSLIAHHAELKERLKAFPALRQPDLQPHLNAVQKRYPHASNLECTIIVPIHAPHAGSHGLALAAGGAKVHFSGHQAHILTQEHTSSFAKISEQQVNAGLGGERDILNDIYQVNNEKTYRHASFKRKFSDNEIFIASCELLEDKNLGFIILSGVSLLAGYKLASLKLTTGILSSMANRVEVGFHHIVQGFNDHRGSQLAKGLLMIASAPLVGVISPIYSAKKSKSKFEPSPALKEKGP